MKQARFTEEQIVAVLQEATHGRPIRELCRQHGITETTFCTSALFASSSVLAYLIAPAATAWTQTVWTDDGRDSWLEGEQGTV